MDILCCCCRLFRKVKLILSVLPSTSRTCYYIDLPPPTQASPERRPSDLASSPTATQIGARITMPSNCAVYYDDPRYVLCCYLQRVWWEISDRVRCIWCERSDSGLLALACSHEHTFSSCCMFLYIGLVSLTRGANRPDLIWNDLKLTAALKYLVVKRTNVPL